MNELSDNNTYGSFIDLPDRSWCEFKLEKQEPGLQICDECPGEEPFCRKECEIFIEAAYD